MIRRILSSARRRAAQWLAANRPAPPSQPQLVPLAPSAYPMQVNYLLPLDYPPSRRDSPRWGATHPLHAGMIALYQRFEQDYDEVLAGLPRYTEEFQRIPLTTEPAPPKVPRWKDVPFAPIDLALLYAIMRDAKPERYVEIGSGVSTLFAAQAKRDGELETQIISIDPCPRTDVDAVCDSVIRESFETADLSIFDKLQPGDIVFMDGSHRSFMNSDVTVFMLDVLPKLAPGVIVHFHDIHLPYDYPDGFTSWHWNEQYILAAYLLGAADRVRILMPSRYVCARPNAPDLFKEIFHWWPGNPADWLGGGSLWFTHI